MSNLYRITRLQHTLVHLTKSAFGNSEIQCGLGFFGNLRNDFLSAIPNEPCFAFRQGGPSESGIKGKEKKAPEGQLDDLFENDIQISKLILNEESM